VAVVAKSAVLADDRFDAQFFKKAYLAEDQALHRHSLEIIGSFAKVTDGPHGYHEVDENSPVAMLTARSAADWFATRVGTDTISAKTHGANMRSSLAVDDIILGTRGTVGNCALVSQDILPANIDQDVARITLTGDAPVKPAFVAAYLNCRFGQDHIVRHSTGMVQQGINLAKVRNIPIPVLSVEFQDKIHQLVTGAWDTRKQRDKAQQTAEAMLIDALGLGGWSPPEPLTYIRSAAAVRAAGRYDASYFAPRYDEAEARVVATGQARRIGDGLASLVKRGSQPLYADSGLPVINSRHVRTNRVLLSDDNRLAAPSRVQILKGDVLVNGTGFGTIGRAAPYMDADPAVPDNHVTVIRPIGVRPLYLSAFLNSQLGQLQIERMISGSSGQIELYPKDIESIYVWVADDAIQLEIEQQMRESFACEAKAQSLLTTAKRGVEIAIEDSEAAALAFLASSVHHD
jgi:hypothetical protein